VRERGRGRGVEWFVYLLILTGSRWCLRHQIVLPLAKGRTTGELSVSLRRHRRTPTLSLSLSLSLCLSDAHFLHDLLRERGRERGRRLTLFHSGPRFLATPARRGRGTGERERERGRGRG
jgi:hypothetical protein